MPATYHTGVRGLIGTVIKLTTPAGEQRAGVVPAFVQVNDDGTNAPVGGNLASSTPDGALSGTISASGGTASVAFVNTARQEVINPSTATLWARWGGTPAVNGAGSFPIAPGGSFSVDRVAGTLQLLSTAASQTYTVNRYA